MTGANSVDFLDTFKSTREKLIELWRSGIPSFCPSEGQWNTWLQFNDANTLMLAVLKTTKKFTQLKGAMDDDYLIRYTSSVANSIRRNKVGVA
jgi:hypothetical protein